MDRDVVRALARAAVELTSRHDRDAVLDAILRELERLVPYDMAAVLICDEGDLRAVAGRGFRRDVDLATVRFRRGENPRLDRALAARGTVCFTNPDEPDPFDGLAPRALDHLHSCMAAPMRVDGRLLGAITADAHAADRFGAEHEELMELFALLAAVAIRNADLISALERAQAQLEGEVATLAEEIRQHAGGIRIVGSSAATAAIRAEIATVAPTDTTVLVLGETGTGKELVARAIHAASRRHARPLIRFDCAAVAPTLIESELFGHVKGAFTGAAGARAGKLEIADGGTLFLDEIGELPLSLQPRLLRALQEHEFERVGDHRVHRFDARIVAATNRDLQREVREGRFRADLFHRLAVYPMRVPPLSERPEDVPELIRFFARKLAPKLHVSALEIDESFEEELASHAWPGNVRELENAVERALVRARARAGSVVRLDAPSARELSLGGERAPTAPSAPRIPPGTTLRRATNEFQLGVIEAALQAADGNVAGAARALGEDRSNLHRLLRRLRGAGGRKEGPAARSRARRRAAKAR